MNFILLRLLMTFDDAGCTYWVERDLKFREHLERKKGPLAMHAGVHTGKGQNMVMDIPFSLS